MLDDIRENKTSLTTYILVGLAGVGMLFIGVPFFAINQGNTVAEVNGQDITMAQFQQAINVVRQNNPNLDNAQSESRAMHQLISQTLLDEHANASGLRYPDLALYQSIKNTFPDTTDYQDFLKRIGMDAADYERLRRAELTTQTYYSILARAQQTTPAITDTFAKNLSQQRSFTIIRLPLAPALKNTTISEADIQSYYDTHQQELMTPEHVAIDYVLFNLSDLIDPSSITEAELTQARQQAATENSKRDGQYLIYGHEADAKQAHQQLTDGSHTYAELSSKIDDGSSDGEHGSFPLHRKGEGADSSADDALFALHKSGDVSDIINTDYGHMIIIAGNIQNGDDISDAELRQRLATQAAEARYHDLTNQAFDAAQDGAKIDTIATMLGVKSQHTQPFAAANPPQPWLKDNDVSSQLFGEHAVATGQMGQPVALSDQQSLFFSVIERQTPYLKPLADIHAQVSEQVRRAQAEQYLSQTAEDIATTWTTQPPSTEQLTSYHASSETYPNLTMWQQNNSLTPTILHDLFQQTTRTAVLNADNGDRLIAHLDSITYTPEDAAVKAVLNRQWQQQSQLMAYQGMLKWLGEHADIKIEYQPTP